jgi:3-dehydroquinate synthase
MKIVRVNLSNQSYEIRVGTGLSGQVGEILADMGFENLAVIITNPVVNGFYGQILLDCLKKAGFKPVILEVPDGEKYKSLEWAGILYNHLVDLNAERGTPILALGGGVIGDLAGFVAATYMRGVPLFQIPTTLLAQVDSSIGGKVAVNHGNLKNNIGTFYQPGTVCSDISVLATLPKEEINNGLAEIIKYGVIRDQKLFKTIEDHLDALKSLDQDIVENVVGRCAAIKAEIVEKDEKDRDLRNILNFGHTVGHAIETVSGFKIPHGYGVAIGMVAAGMISQKMGLLPASDLDRLKSLLIKSGLPVSISGLATDSIIQTMKHDKKISGGRVKFILLKTIGNAFISDNVDLDLVGQVLREI